MARTALQGPAQGSRQTQRAGGGQAVRALLAAGLSVLALVVGGCISIKTEGLSQPRAPGVVTIGGVVCGSDYNRDSYPGCDGDADDGTPVNVAEPDNRANNGGCDADGGPDDGSCSGLTGNGQLLAGFRVPTGSDGPDTFLTDAGDIHFTKNSSYTDQLEVLFPAPPGEHWVGYVSDVRTFATGTAAENPTGIHPEFTLPTGSDGAPFAGPYHWRFAVGFRRVEIAQAATPVTCTDFATFCVDSPPQAQVPNDLPPANVSDFGVRSGGTVNVPQTQTATITFPVPYQDAAGLGAKDLSITTSTNLPGSTATPSTKTLSAAPNAENPVRVTVPVPLTTPQGSYVVTLTAATGSPPVTRSNTGKIVVGPPPDADGDGVADPFDKCPTTPRGQFDADNDGCVGPYKRITSVPSGGWTVSDKGVTIGSMGVDRLPRGARVKLTCKPCRVNQTLTAKGTSVNLKKLHNKLLRRKKGFTVTITKLGFIGERVTLTVKKFGHTNREFNRIAKKPFKKTQRCIPVGSTAPAKTCSATPPTGP